jgi:toxin ParE1/3/4
MRTVSRTPLAAQDVREIVDYLLEYSEPAAERFTAELETACRLLTSQPRMGRDRDDLVLGVRSVVVGKYLVFFRASDEAIQVLRVIHGARNITPEMFEGL